jgi:hypothetical protein
LRDGLAQEAKLCKAVCLYSGLCSNKRAKTAWTWPV